MLKHRNRRIAMRRLSLSMQNAMFPREEAPAPAKQVFRGKTDRRCPLNFSLTVVAVGIRRSNTGNRLAVCETAFATDHRRRPHSGLAENVGTTSFRTSMLT